MSDLNVQIILEQDPMSGPLVEHMRRYTPEQFQSYVVNRSSDGARRDIMLEDIALYQNLQKLVGTSGTVTRKISGVREEILRERSAIKDDPFDTFSPHSDLLERLKKPRHYFSGPEFGELAQVLITLGGTVLTVPAMKATKEIVVKWLEGRAKRKLTLKAGNHTLKIEGPASKKKINEAFAQLQKLSTVAIPTKSKIEKSPLKKAAKKAPARKKKAPRK